MQLADFPPIKKYKSVPEAYYVPYPDAVYSEAVNYLIDMAVSVGDKRMAGMLKCYLNKPDIIKCNIIAAMFHRKAHSRFIDKLIMDVRNEADNYVKRTFNSDEEAQYKIVHNKALKALDRYKEAGYEGKIGIVHSLESKYPYDEAKEEDIKAAKNEDVLNNQFLLDATFLGEYRDETMEIINHLVELNNGSFHASEEDMEVLKKAASYNDYLGINYYQSRFIRHYDGENDIFHNGTGEKGTSRFCLKGVGERMDKEGIPKTDWDWLIYPEGLYDMIMRIKKDYPNYKAIYITENGMGYKDDFVDGEIDDSPRIDYIKKHLEWILRAISCGANVEGYFVWSLMDMFSWTNGYNKRYGLFYVDYETQKRYPKKSAYWYHEVSKTKEL